MDTRRIFRVRQSLTALLVLLGSQHMVFGHHAEAMQGNPWIQGLSMPLHGLDHMLMAIGVGIIAVQLGGRALWMVPTGFSMVLVAGGLLNLTGTSVPFLEQMILASLVLASVQLGVGLRVPAGIIVVVFSLLGAFHGQALIQPLLAGNTPGSLLAFTAGCVLSSLLLLLTGLGMGMLLRERAAETNRFRYAGAVLLVGSLLIVLVPEANGWLVGIVEGIAQ